MNGVTGRIRPANTYDVFIRDRVQVVVESAFPGQPRGVWRREMQGDLAGTVISEGFVDDVDHALEPADWDPFLVLDAPDFIARAVYEALRDRYEPELAEANRLSRADLDGERARVDRLIDVVSRVALDGVDG